MMKLFLIIIFMLSGIISPAFSDVYLEDKINKKVHRVGLGLLWTLIVVLISFNFIL